MKTISSGMLAYLADETVPLTTCWLLTLTNGTIYGFTEWDNDIVIGGQTYAASTGYTRSAIKNAANLAPSDLEVMGLLDSGALTETDINAGLYDFASFQIFLVNPADLTVGSVALRGGVLGEVRNIEGQYTAELRSLTQLLDRSMIELYQLDCLADFGDARCTFDVSTVTYTGTVGTIDRPSRIFQALFQSPTIPLVLVDGFDHELNETDLQTKWGGPQGGTINISSSYSRYSGGNGAQFTSGSSLMAYFPTINPSPQAESVVLSFDAKFASGALLRLTGSARLFGLFGSTQDDSQFYIDLNKTDAGTNFDAAAYTAPFGSSGTLLGTATTTLLSDGNWHRVDVQVNVHTTAGIVLVKVDGTTVLTLSGVDTAGSYGFTFDSDGPLGNWLDGVNFGVSNANVEIDNVLIGTYPSALLSDATFGLCQVWTTFPSSNSAVQFTPLTGTNYAEVDETAMDSDTSYNATSDIGNADLFADTFGAPTAGFTNVLAVAVTAAGKTASGTGAFYTQIKSGTALSTSAYAFPTTTGAYSYGQSISMVDPSTEALWLEAAAEAALFGYEFAPFALGLGAWNVADVYQAPLFPTMAFAFSDSQADFPNSGNNGWCGVPGNQSYTTGKYVFELQFALPSPGATWSFGIIGSAYVLGPELLGGDTASNSIGIQNGGTSLLMNSAVLGTVPVIQNAYNYFFAIDFDAKLFWMYDKNGTGYWNGAPGNSPDLGIGGISFAGIGTGPYTAAFNGSTPPMYSSNKAVATFGQDPIPNSARTFIPSPYDVGGTGVVRISQVVKETVLALDAPENALPLPATFANVQVEVRKKGDNAPIIYTEVSHTPSASGQYQVAIINAFTAQYTFYSGDIGLGVEISYTVNGDPITVFGVIYSTGTVLVTFGELSQFPNGIITWTSGVCSGMKQEIKSWSGDASSILTLFLNSNFVFSTGDTFTAQLGCDKNYRTCLYIWNNLLNFRGFPFVPGLDVYLNPNAGLQYQDVTD
jgi:hypothetical protein